MEANYFTPGAAGSDPAVRGPARRRTAVPGRPRALADGGYEKLRSPICCRFGLPDHKNTFHRDPATAELTPAGRDSLITRIEENPDANVERWKKLPYLMNFQEAGQPKPGALVLAEMTACAGTSCRC